MQEAFRGVLACHGPGNPSLPGKARGFRGQDTVERHGGFDGVPIGISDGLTENRRFRLARFRVSGCPVLENPLGAVEMLLVPSDRHHLDAATGWL